MLVIVIILHRLRYCIINSRVRTYESSRPDEICFPCVIAGRSRRHSTRRRRMRRSFVHGVRGAGEWSERGGRRRYNYSLFSQRARLAALRMVLRPVQVGCSRFVFRRERSSALHAQATHAAHQYPRCGRVDRTTESRSRTRY
ncbi:unnamed protein product [Aphis gossypii]|uniref:Uncharacterized protein n=1 Tax=Aphis gossypii TaxID=80765 RepID=A0A9P0NSW4_APHGO|nr:unnamed protein product [Aphis gossypii]